MWLLFHLKYIFLLYNHHSKSSGNRKGKCNVNIIYSIIVAWNYLIKLNILMCTYIRSQNILIKYLKCTFCNINHYQGIKTNKGKKYHYDWSSTSRRKNWGKLIPSSLRSFLRELRYLSKRETAEEFAEFHYRNESKLHTYVYL